MKASRVGISCLFVILITLLPITPVDAKRKPSDGNSTTASAGTLDTSFGSGGKVTTDFGGRRDTALATAIQPDGKIVVVGCEDELSWSCSAFGAFGKAFEIARYLPTGHLDPGFGNGGKVVTHIEYDGTATDVAIQPDGKIVVVGSATSCVGTVTVCSTGIAVARYNPDGSLDLTFGLGGKLTVNPVVAGYAALYGAGVALQPDGRILVAGKVCNTKPFTSGCPWDMVTARFLPGGQLDPSFGGTGLVTADVAGGRDSATSVLVQPDGRIVVGGVADLGDTCTDVCVSNWDFALVRYTSAGQLDPSFGEAGKVTTDFSGEVSPIRDMQLQTLDGVHRIVAGGDVTRWTCFPTHCTWVRDVVLSAYSLDGALVSTFGTGGKVTTDAGGDNQVGQIAIDAAGRIHLASSACTTNLSGNTCDVVALRYTPLGAADGSWGKNGIVTTDFGGIDRGLGVAVQPGDRKVVVAGATETNNARDFAVARYLP